MTHNARAWADDALEMLGHSDLSVRIEFNKRFTSKMGDACYRSPVGPRVRLSAPMWPLIATAERRDTVIHEICHIVVRHEALASCVRGVKAHGPEWKSKMRACGLEPRRCHDFDVSKAPGSRRTKKLHCGCPSPHMVSARKYNQAASGKSNYRCKRCKRFCLPGMLPQDLPALLKGPSPKPKPKPKPTPTPTRLAEWLRKATEK